MKVIKGFLKGLLYVILSPLILVGFALYAVYSLFVFIWEFIVASIKFFSGKKLTTELKEDKMVKQLVEEKDKEYQLQKEKEQAQAEITPQPTSNTTINNFYITPDQLPINQSQNIPSTENNNVQAIENKEILEIEEQIGGNENE